MGSKNEKPRPKPSVLENRPNAFLIVPALSLLLGQALASPKFEFLPVALLAAVLVLLSCFLGARLWKPALLVFLSGGTLLVGYLMHDKIIRPKFSVYHLRSVSISNDPLYVEAVHYREPERLPDRSRWYLRAERIWLPDGARDTEGQVLVTVAIDRMEWHYGDRVRLWLKPRPPYNLGNPGSFDYESYLARREIYLTSYLSTDSGVELLERQGTGFWVWVEGWRRRMGRFFEQRLDSAGAGLLKALVVGDMGGITREMRERSAAAGVAHVLSISGLHVGMLGLVVFFLVRLAGSFSSPLMLRWNLLKIATFFSFLAVLFYTCLAGAMVPTVRSAIMIGVYELAVLLDREEEVFSSLALAALLIGLAWPGVIMDISFQLSFLSVLAIAWGIRKAWEWWPVKKVEEHPVERRWWKPRLRRLVYYVAVPVLATLGTGPLIAHHFGHLSLAGFVSNPIIVPLVGFVLVPTGLITGFVSLGFPGLAGFLLIVVKPLLWATEKLINIFSSLPLASIRVPIPSVVEVGLIYVILFSFLVIQSRAQFLFVMGAAALTLSGWSYYGWSQIGNRNALRVTHLSVGQGDAAVVEFPDAKVLLIDAGGAAGNEFDPGESIVAPFLRSRKILKIDYLALAHPRVDHSGGMKAIVDQFTPSEFWSAAGSRYPARYDELEQALSKARVKRRLLSTSDGCQTIEGVELCVLYPSTLRQEASLVLRLRYGKASFFFAGDVTAEDEKSILSRRESLFSTVVKVPHHGSANSSTEQFVKALNPRVAVFSVGYRNPFGLPREEVMARYRDTGADILRTDVDGAVTLETDGKVLEYRTHKTGRKNTTLLEDPVR